MDRLTPMVLFEKKKVVLHERSSQIYVVLGRFKKYDYEREFVETCMSSHRGGRKLKRRVIVKGIF